MWKNLGSFALHSRFQVEDGQVLGLLGGSGCGKSMTLRCIAGVVRPDRGVIRLGDWVLFDSRADIDLPPQQRRVGLMFQSYALFPSTMVEQNIAVGIGEKDKKRSRQIVERYLELLRIQELQTRRLWQLSGGQQQQVDLARMMAQAPELLMLDEPFSALDSHLRGSIEEDFLRVLAGFGGPALLVSHSVDEVYRYCSATALMGRAD